MLRSSKFQMAYKEEMYLMKKLFAILLAAAMLLSLAACGAGSATKVAILWDDAGTVQVPNSLINAVERAMYTKSVAYTHYGANGDQAKQAEQAAQALEQGCAALLVKLVDAAGAQEIVDLAKAANVPVIFFACEVDEAVASGYDKCICVNTDADSLSTAQGEMLEEALIKEEKGLFSKEATYSVNEEMDRNEDGEITYLAIGDVAGTVEAINAILEEKELPALVSAGEGADASRIESLTESVHVTEKEVEMGLLVSAEGVSVDLILTDSDAAALDVLVALQARGYNANKLTTHCIPLYTVGSDADYKAYVLADRPEGTREDAAVMEYYEQMQYLVDLTTVKDEDLEVMVYNTYNVIDSGRIAGTAVQDYDAIAAAMALIAKNLLTGNELLKDVDAEQVTDGWLVKIPYTTYTG